jgi:hypothetical protein
MTDITICNANFLHKTILPLLSDVLHFDWYYYFQCGSFYTKLYYLSIELYHIITNVIIFNAGLDANVLALHPEDNHIFRLAKLITEKQCYRLVIKLGMSNNAWKDNSDLYSNTSKVIMRFCALRERKDRRFDSSFRELSNALAEDYHTHLLCQVGNYCSHRCLFNCMVCNNYSHRWLVHCIIGSNCSHRWLLYCMVGNKCSHRWLFNCIVGNNCSHRGMFNSIVGNNCRHRWLVHCTLGNNRCHRWLFNCMVGNNCSHRWLFNCIVGNNCSHRWLFNCMVGNNCTHRWLVHCILGNNCRHR